MTGRLLACGLLMLAAGCAVRPPPAGELPWPERRELLQSVQDWSMRGRVAIAAADEGLSAGLAWQQSGDSGRIDLSGPFGAGGLQVRYDGERVVVDGAQGLAAGDAGTLLESRVPVQALRYWVLGIPAPGSEHRATLDTGGRLVALVQDGWEIRYDRYQPAGPLTLPTRLDLHSGELRVRLAVSSWQLGP